MVRYTVAFEAEGTTKSISVGEAQFKKGHLRCQDERNSDSVTVAIIPESSVKYVVEESTTITDVGSEDASEDGDES